MHIEKLLLEMDKEPALEHILYTEVDERGTRKRDAKRRSEVHAIVDMAYNSIERKEIASAMCIFDGFLEKKTEDNEGPFSRYTIDKIKWEIEEGEEGENEKDTLCFDIRGESVGLAMMMDYTFGQFVIGYAVPNSDEKPPMHIEKLLLEMDKEPALKNILYIEVDERVTSKRGEKRRIEMMDYTFGQFVIGYAVPNSDEKPPMHIENLLLEMDKEPALEHILYTEEDESETSKRGVKRTSEKTEDNKGPFSRYTIDKIKWETEEGDEGENEEGEDGS
ncbi:hypothetical protein Q3G72_015583 [Acer saccharum]|nr:hypothetical protein Q3G72_015583 [Acer saccharum]